MSESKLHQLLAVEGDLEGAFKKIVKETEGTFKKRPDHFIGFHRTCKIFTPEEEGGEKPPPDEHKHMDTTVRAKLDYQSKYVVRYFDALLQKEATNQKAIADLVVDGVTIAEGLPATFLLGLESRLKYLREAYDAMPTTSPGVEWRKSEQHGEDVWEAVHPEEAFKTAKKIVPQILYDATEHHPAQVEKLPVTENIGLYQKRIWSGMLSPKEKSEVLERIDRLIRAVKKARQKANSTKVEKRKCGQILMDFIHGKKA